MVCISLVYLFGSMSLEAYCNLNWEFGKTPVWNKAISSTIAHLFQPASILHVNWYKLFRVKHLSLLLMRFLIDIFKEIKVLTASSEQT